MILGEIAARYRGATNTHRDETEQTTNHLESIEEGKQENVALSQNLNRRSIIKNNM